MAELRRIAIFRSLHRHALLFGAERELVLFSALILSIFLFSAVYTASTGLVALGAAAVLAWLIALGLFRAMAKADPMMTKVYLRHIQQAPFYPARSGPWRVDRRTRIRERF